MGVAHPRWGRNLIVRILSGRVQPGQVTAFRDQARQALIDARQQAGLVYAQIGRQSAPDGAEEISFVSVWHDLDALYRWVGGTDLLDTPVLSRGGNPDLLQRFEVQHYETYELAEVELPHADAAADAPSSRFSPDIDRIIPWPAR